VSLPTPSLDDRRFQDIVDEAKRLIPRYCPEWTDHNVSDPGIALVELFAWMSEMIIYRLNQMPDVNYVRFLDLVGVKPFPPLTATSRIAFWLSTPQTAPVEIPAGTEVGTQRTETQESIVFTTEKDLRVVPPKLTSCVTVTAEGNPQDAWDDLRLAGREVKCFRGPKAGDGICLGFASSLAGNVLRFTVTTASAAGIGIDPLRPPWMWEAWSGESWERVEVLKDSTGGFNADGEVVLAIPAQHEDLTLGNVRAFWVKCSMTEPEQGHQGYQSSPSLGALEAVSIGGVMLARHAMRIGAEPLGLSEGTPGQHFRVRKPPVLTGPEGPTITVVTEQGTQKWERVDDFSLSSSTDQHFTLDPVSGEVAFGPSVRNRDGVKRQHGAVPVANARIVIDGYGTGGGARGNVGTGTLCVLKSAIPFVARVENLDPGAGGVDGETIDELKVRGPLTLRTGQRAVTVEDFERVVLDASPLVARAKCVPPSEPGGPIQVLVVPRLDAAMERPALDDFALPPDLIDQVTPEVDKRRILTSTVEITTPKYKGLCVVARVRGGVSLKNEALTDRLLAELYRYINPLVGGLAGEGWPFGRGINIGEVFALLAAVEGVVGVEEVRLYSAELRTGERKDGGQEVALLPNELFISFQHQVKVR